MAKQDEQATGLGLDFKQVDVVDQIMGIIYGIISWVIELAAMAVNIIIAIMNWLFALIGI